MDESCCARRSLGSTPRGLVEHICNLIRKELAMGGLVGLSSLPGELRHMRDPVSGLSKTVGQL